MPMMAAKIKMLLKLRTKFVTEIGKQIIIEILEMDVLVQWAVVQHGAPRPCVGVAGLMASYPVLLFWIAAQAHSGRHRMVVHVLGSLSLTLEIQMTFLASG